MLKKLNFFRTPEEKSENLLSTILSVLGETMSWQKLKIENFIELSFYFEILGAVGIWGTNLRFGNAMLLL